MKFKLYIRKQNTRGSEDSYLIDSSGKLILKGVTSWVEREATGRLGLVIDEELELPNLTFFYDKQRHLVCKPYSVENLHCMAAILRIDNCWYHNTKHKHYDIPKKMFDSFWLYPAKKVSPRDILKICKGEL